MNQPSRKAVSSHSVPALPEPEAAARRLPEQRELNKGGTQSSPQALRIAVLLLALKAQREIGRQ